MYGNFIKSSFAVTYLTTKQRKMYLSYQYYVKCEKLIVACKLSNISMKYKKLHS